jgi:sterol desaturase/sphingolipid hydroxylase (fatty acid hydroxylase superfamily)
MTWILAILGLYITFMRKYVARRNKQGFNFEYWIKDNWPELSQSVALLLACMIILVSKDSIIDLNAWMAHKFPALSESSFNWKWIVSFLLGFSITEIMYWLNKRKRNWTKENQ